MLSAWRSLTCLRRAEADPEVQGLHGLVHLQTATRERRSPATPTFARFCSISQVISPCLSEPEKLFPTLAHHPATMVSSANLFSSSSVILIPDLGLEGQESQVHARCIHGLGTSMPSKHVLMFFSFV